MNKEKKIFNKEEYKVIKLILRGIFNIYSLIGTGKKYEIDSIMTQKFDELSLIYDDYDVLSIEGKRDGVIVAEIQNTKNQDSSKRKIVLDPIDGTLPCSKGGSRSISAIAIANHVTNNILKVPDNISCFSFGSNINPFYGEVLNSTGFESEFMKKMFQDSGMISTLHRKESEKFWEEYFENEDKLIVGENTCYFPNELSHKLFKAGDTSIPLFLETDSYIGRSGGTEALIEARLWKFWSGLLVSGEKIKNFHGGPNLYLRERVKYSKNFFEQGAKLLFEKWELEQLYKLGWSNEKIMKPLNGANFSPDYDFIAIASITGTFDQKFKIHSNRNLRPILFDKIKHQMTVNFWVKNKNYVGFLNCIYNIKTGDVTWKKMSI